MATLTDSCSIKESIDFYDPDTSLRDIIRTKVVDTSKRKDTDDGFYVVDLGKAVSQYERWRKCLPRVHPFYAIKCNPDPMILRVLVKLGAGFDCGSKNEIGRALGVGASPSDIIYANTCKQQSHVRFAKQTAIHLMTFDNEDELIKIKEHFPEAHLVLRLATDDSASLVKLSCKYGCDVDEALGLLKIAKKLSVSVTGVSFHVGSLCRDPESFVEPIKAARRVFDEALELGFNMTILDIGGGFPGDLLEEQPLEKFADVINRELDVHFPANLHPSLRIIAEPGRYFAGPTYTAVLNVIARKVVKQLPHNICKLEIESVFDHHEGDEFKYYLNDGFHGSFLHLTNKPIVLIPACLKERDDQAPAYSCSIWGQTCNGIDIITKYCRMPKLLVGEWVFFEAIGAYSIASASTFNGFDILTCYYVAPKCHQSLFLDTAS